MLIRSQWRALASTSTHTSLRLSGWSRARMASTSTTSADRSYSAAIDALNSLQSNAATIAATRAAGGKYNDWLIPEMVEYLGRVGHTQQELDRLNVIHITGTKGKGSTAAFSNALLLKAFDSTQKATNSQEPRVGLYTSPHMLLVRERIRLDGAPISEQDFARAFWHVWDAFDATADQRARPEVTPARPVYFKFLTVMAFHIFLSIPSLRAVVLEVGIGGKYDSTNIVPHPVACGISTLGLDHQAVLGSTIEEIAAQKAGIYKSGSPAISVSQPFKQTEAILQSASENAQASSFEVLPPVAETGLAHQALGLPGPHQAGNALLATELVDSYLKHAADDSSSSSTSSPALPTSVWEDKSQWKPAAWTLQALKDAKWPGRCQIVPLAETSTAPRYYLDGAHTVDSLALCASWFLLQSPLEQSQVERTLIFNCTMGRNVGHLLAALLEPIKAALGSSAKPSEAVLYFDRVLFCTNTTYSPGSAGGGGDLTNKMVDSTELRTLAVQTELRDAWVQLAGSLPGIKDRVKVLPSIEDAMSAVPKQGEGKQQQVLVAGSLHLVGGVMSHLKDAGALDDKLESIHAT